MKKGTGLIIVVLVLFSFISISTFSRDANHVPVNSLQQVLQSIEGIGRVEVYLHEHSASEMKSLFQTGTHQANTNGVLIVCEGADNVKVRKQLYDAIERVMGIPSYRIMILPMKKEAVQ